MGMRTNLIAPTFMPTQQNASVAEALEKKGVKLSTTEAAASAVIRCLADEAIEGKLALSTSHRHMSQTLFGTLFPPILR